MELDDGKGKEVFSKKRGVFLVLFGFMPNPKYGNTSQISGQWPSYIYRICN